MRDMYRPVFMEMPEAAEDQPAEVVNCKNCGAPLDAAGKCAYCGSIWKVQPRELGPPMIVSVYSSPVQTISTEVRLSRHMHPMFDSESFPVELAETDGGVTYIMDQMRHQLADGLKDMIKLTTRIEPGSDVQVIRGTVRVVPPDFLF